MKQLHLLLGALIIFTASIDIAATQQSVVGGYIVSVPKHLIVSIPCAKEATSLFRKHASKRKYNDNAVTIKLEFREWF